LFFGIIKRGWGWGEKVGVLLCGGGGGGGGGK
jgi:hypothetical protein